MGSLGPSVLKADSLAERQGSEGRSLDFLGRVSAPGGGGGEGVAAEPGVSQQPLRSRTGEYRTLCTSLDAPWGPDRGRGCCGALKAGIWGGGGRLLCVGDRIVAGGLDL